MTRGGGRSHSPAVDRVPGATAAQAMLGKEFRITKSRGKCFETGDATWLMATYHPSAVLRTPDREARHRMRGEFVDDLRHAAERVESAVAGA